MKKEEIGTLAGIVWRALNEKGSLSFEDLQRETPLWRLDDVPEEVGKYPEFSMFGECPLGVSMYVTSTASRFIVYIFHFAIAISVPPSSSTMYVSSRWNKSLLMNPYSISLFCSRYEEDVTFMHIVAAVV